MSDSVLNLTMMVEGKPLSVILDTNDAIRKIVGSVRDATRELQGFKGWSDQVTKNIRKYTNALNELTGSSLEFEQQQANLKTLLGGDEDAVEKLIGKIREYSNVTNYDRTSLLEAQQAMMSLGVDADVAFGKLKNIGDIALGDSDKMNTLAIAFGQVSSMGYLTTQNLNQMVSAGFNPLETISQNTNLTMEELSEALNNGSLSADLIAQSFEWATEEGGLFYEGAANAADTTAGHIAIMQQKIDDMKVAVFEATGGVSAWISEIGNLIVPITQLYPIVESVWRLGRTGITWLIGQWPKLVTFVKTGIVNVALNMQILKYAITSAGGFFPWLKGIATMAFKGISTALYNIPIVGWVALAIGVVTTLTAYLYNHFESVRAFLDGIGSLIVGLIPGLGLLINIVTSFAKHWQSVKTAFADGGILQGLKRIGFVLIDAMLKPVQALLDLLSRIPGLSNLAARGRDAIAKMRDNLDKATIVVPKEKVAADTEVLDAAAPKPRKAELALGGGRLGASAGSSAGKAQQIHINVGNMVGAMNFNGGLSQNRAMVESQLAEMMARILSMAETAV